MQSPEILGKPSGVTLEEHTANVLREAQAIMKARPQACQKYNRVFGTDLIQIVEEIARWHDEGKKHEKWQTACRKDFAEFWAWMQRNHPDVARSQAPPYFGRFKAASHKAGKKVGQNLLKAKLRHEFHSLVLRRKQRPLPPTLQYVAIAAHHAKLSHKQRKRFDDDLEFLVWRDKFFHEWGAIDGNDLQKGNFEKFVLKRYEYDAPRALLQLADHRASACESGEELPELKPFIYNFPYRDTTTGEPSYRGVQEIITQLWDDKLAILRAPTGAGKTDAALIWAKHQIEKGRADRLIIAMPTRFTSNALAVSTKKSLTNQGIYHSTAYFNRKANEAGDDKSKARWIEKEQELARQLETPTTITTLDHLCLALTGAREDHHSIFWGLANSCVVIDEADFYDEFTQYNLVTLLRALRVLDVRVLIMSATVPPSALELYSLSGTPLKQIYEDKSDLERTRCRVHFNGEMETPADIADLLQAALNGTPTIIYANTVKRAQAYCDWFVGEGWHARENDDDESDNAFVLYHSRFTEPDKARKEKHLIEMLGADAWDDKKADKPRGVAILTQIGELSVNISANLMISDLCPVDRLAQRAGRLARFKIEGEHVIGDLHIVTPFRTNNKGERGFYPAPYGEFEMRVGWTPTDALLKTQTWLTANDFSAQTWINGVKHVYSLLQTPSSRTVKNQSDLEDLLIINWMLVRANEADEDDENVDKWKSRDIPPQKKVYVGVEASSSMDNDSEPPFISWRRFREWEQSHAISVMVYEHKLGLENHSLEDQCIAIGEDEETIFLARPYTYSFARGLRLTPQEDESGE